MDGNTPTRWHRDIDLKICEYDIVDRSKQYCEAKQFRLFVHTILPKILDLWPLLYTITGKKDNHLHWLPTVDF